jgi:nucleoside-diphosphate-sugar epimerase
MGCESQMKVLITGGLGYLGSVLIDKLIEKGFSVKVLDLLMYGNFLTQKGRNVELIKGDVRDYNVLLKTTEDVEAVIHLAGIIGDSAANLDKELTINVNYLATRQLAELCAKRGLKLIFSSTCSVYGARPGEVITEKSQIAPLSLYAMSKLVSEEAIKKRCNDYVIFRLGTLFGLSPRMRFDLVINRFIAQAIQDRKIAVYGGHQRRPFVHVQDISDIFIKALNNDTNGIYNVGGNNYKILSAAEIIKGKVGCNVSVISDLKDPRDYAVDSALAEETFMFRDPKKIEFAVDEIKDAYTKRVIKDYKESIFSNEEWLKQLWR